MSELSVTGMSWGRLLGVNRRRFDRGEVELVGCEIMGAGKKEAEG